MPFESEVDLRNVRNRESEWILLSKLCYRSERYRFVIAVPKGFVTDLASVPRLPVVYTLFGGRGNAAAVIHDWCYRTGCTTKGEADLLFLDGMKDCEIGLFTREFMYLGVKYGGWFTWKDYEKARKDGHPTYEIRNVDFEVF